LESSWAEVIKKAQKKNTRKQCSVMRNDAVTQVQVSCELGRENEI
jgi:hypothetical protein